MSKFSQLIQIALNSGVVDNRDLAAEFEVARTTPVRWAEGVSAPHPRIQKQVVAFIKPLLTNRITEWLDEGHEYRTLDKMIEEFDDEE